MNLSYSLASAKRLYKKIREHNAFRLKNTGQIGALYLKLLPSILYRSSEKKEFTQRIQEINKREDPVFVIGHWRSGTTFLQFLLSKDPQFVWHDKYQGLFPDIYLSTKHSMRPFADKFLSTFKAVKEWKENISADMDLASPIEIESAFVNNIEDTTYHWGHLFPLSWEEYTDRYLFMNDISDEEFERWKSSMIYACKKLRLEKPDKRVLIKNPGDTGRIEKLLQIYPDAKFVFIHRNPYDVFYSNKKLWRGITDTISLQSPDESEIENLILNTYVKLHHRYLKSREILSEDQTVEVGMEDLKSKPEQELSRIYNKLNIKGLDSVKEGMLKYIDEPEQRKISPYDYNNAHIEEINEKWCFAFSEWGYERIAVDKMTSRAMHA